MQQALNNDINKICDLRTKRDKIYNNISGDIDDLIASHWTENHINLGCENDINECTENHDDEFTRSLQKINDEILTLWRANSYLKILHCKK